MQFTLNNIDEIKKFIPGTIQERRQSWLHEETSLVAVLRSGVYRVAFGDYVVKDKFGNIMIFSNSVFKSLYRRIKD